MTWRSEAIPIQARLPEYKRAMPSHFVDKITTPSDVACGSCTLCCRTLIVPLADEEYEQFEGSWAWITTPDGERHGRALKRNPDGSCIFLNENGCSIHGRAPHVCKRFDCRELFLKSDRKGRRKTVSNGTLPKSLFDRGRELLKQTQEK